MKRISHTPAACALGAALALGGCMVEEPFEM